VNCIKIIGIETLPLSDLTHSKTCEQTHSK